MVQNGALVNVIDRDFVTPLILASNLGDIEMTKLLISNGAKLNHKDRMNSTALHYACLRSHSEVAKELIINGCIQNTNTPFSFASPLKYLVMDTHYAVAKMLVESGCDLKHEKWILDDFFVKKYNIDIEFIEWIRNHIKNPKRLLMQSRITIRKCIGSEILAFKVNTLQIPMFLKKYLLISD